MANHSIQPRILFVTPEVIFIPDGSGNHFDYIAKTSLEFADFPGDIVFDLMELGADIHLTQPDYRKAFADIQKSLANFRNKSSKFF